MSVGNAGAADGEREVYVFDVGCTFAAGDAVLAEMETCGYR